MDLGRQPLTTGSTALHGPDFLAVFESSPAAILLVSSDDPVFTVVAVSDAYLKIAGVRREDLLGRGTFEVFAGNSDGSAFNGVRNVRASFQRAIEKGAPDHIPAQRYDIQRTTETGTFFEERYWSLLATPIRGSDRSVEYVLQTVEDVTDKVRESVQRAESEVHAQQPWQMQEDSRRWRELLLQTPAAIAVLLGPEHRFEWVNAEFLRLVSRSSQAMMLGKALRDALPEVAGQGYADEFDRVYQSGAVYKAPEALVRFGEANGCEKEVYIDLVCLPTRNRQGQVDGLFLHATDLTDWVASRKQVEDSERQFRTLAETIPHLALDGERDGAHFLV